MIKIGIFLLFSSLKLSISELSREITFINNCDKSIWLDLTAGAASYAAGKSSCYSDSDCIQGSECNTLNSICFWNVPTPSNGNFRIDSGESSFVTFPILDNNIIWSGNIRVCVNGTCNEDETKCNTEGCRVNSTSPVSLAEFTFVKSGVDYYDISILNGYNIPMEFAPLEPYANSSDPYFCGNPGGRKSRTGYGSCSWEFNPPSYQFNWVKGGGAPCTSDVECDTESDICGMNDQGYTSCGELVGYWSHDQFCGQNLGKVYPDAKCDAPLPSPNQGQTVWNLLGCVDVPSCYQEASGSNCCGCVNWQDEIQQVAPSTVRCNFQNPNWLTYIKPNLLFLKQACPSAYTYPYDDHSSTYVCSYTSSETSVNVVNYQINFCPM